MRYELTDTQVTIWLTDKETYDWAHRPGEAWPCSVLSGSRCRVTFDRGGILDLTVNGKSDNLNIPADELRAITCDFAKRFLPDDHALWPIVTGQPRQPHIYRRGDFVTMQCADGHPDNGDTEFYLHSKCHIESPTWTKFDKASGLLIVECAECRELIARIMVAD